MPKYKLTYFDAKALAEPIRLMLSYLEEDFEDSRFGIEEWPSIKSSMPFGKVPVLAIDGKQLHQSTAITRFLGKQANLNGKNDWEALQIDMAVETIHDLRTAIADFHYEKNETMKAKKKEVSLRDTVPFYLSRIEEMVKSNGGFLANGALSWGDIYLFGVSDYLNRMMGMDMFEKHPNLKALRDKVAAIPQIKAWVAKRPVTEF